MAINRIQRTDGHSAFSTTLATSAFGSSNTAGNAILVFINGISGSPFSVSSVTDTAGNRYRSVTSIYRIQDNTTIDIFSTQNIAAKSGNIVTAHSSTATMNNIIAIEFSGLAKDGNMYEGGIQQPGPDYAFTSNQINMSTGYLFTTNPNDLLVMIGTISTNTGTWTLGPGFSNLENPVTVATSFAVESRVVSAAGTYGGIFTQSTVNQYISGTLLAFSDTNLAASQSPSASLSPSSSISASVSPSASISPSASVSPSSSLSPSLSPSASLSPSSSQSASPSASTSPSASSSPSASISPSASASRSLSPSASSSPSSSYSPSASLSASLSPSASISSSGSPSFGPPGIPVTIDEPRVTASVDTDSSPVSIES